MRIILVGFQRVGKTTFGGHLANQLGIPFIDTDDLMIDFYQREYNKKISIREIYKDLGEKTFRELEYLMLCTPLPNPAIVAVGGGAQTHPYSRKRIKELGYVIYLQKDKHEVYKSMEKHRPAYLNPKSFKNSFEKIYQTRVLQYQDIAQKTLATSYLSEKEILEGLVSIYQSL